MASPILGHPIVLGIFAQHILSPSCIMGTKEEKYLAALSAGSGDEKDLAALIEQINVKTTCTPAANPLNLQEAVEAAQALLGDDVIAPTKATINEVLGKVDSAVLVPMPCSTGITAPGITLEHQKNASKVAISFAAKGDGKSQDLKSSYVDTEVPNVDNWYHGYNLMLAGESHIAIAKSIAVALHKEGSDLAKDHKDECLLAYYLRRKGEALKSAVQNAPDLSCPSKSEPDDKCNVTAKVCDVSELLCKFTPSLSAFVIQCAENIILKTTGAPLDDFSMTALIMYIMDHPKEDILGDITFLRAKNAGDIKSINTHDYKSVQLYDAQVHQIQFACGKGGGATGDDGTCYDAVAIYCNGVSKRLSLWAGDRTEPVFDERDCRASYRYFLTGDFKADITPDQCYSKQAWASSHALVMVMKSAAQVERFLQYAQSLASHGRAPNCLPDLGEVVCSPKPPDAHIAADFFPSGDFDIPVCKDDAPKTFIARRQMVLDNLLNMRKQRDRTDRKDGAKLVTALGKTPTGEAGSAASGSANTEYDVVDRLAPLIYCRTDGKTGGTPPLMQGQIPLVLEDDDLTRTRDSVDYKLNKSLYNSETFDDGKTYHVVKYLHIKITEGLTEGLDDAATSLFSTENSFQAELTFCLVGQHPFQSTRTFFVESEEFPIEIKDADTVDSANLDVISALGKGFMVAKEAQAGKKPTIFVKIGDDDLNLGALADRCKAVLSGKVVPNATLHSNIEEDLEYFISLRQLNSSGSLKDATLELGKIKKVLTPGSATTTDEIMKTTDHLSVLFNQAGGAEKIKLRGLNPTHALSVEVTRTLEINYKAGPEINTSNDLSDMSERDTNDEDKDLQNPAGGLNSFRRQIVCVSNASFPVELFGERSTAQAVKKATEGTFFFAPATSVAALQGEFEKKVVNFNTADTNGLDGGDYKADDGTKLASFIGNSYHCTRIHKIYQGALNGVCPVSNSITAHAVVPRRSGAFPTDAGSPSDSDTIGRGYFVIRVKGAGPSASVSFTAASELDIKAPVVKAHILAGFQTSSSALTAFTMGLPTSNRADSEDSVEYIAAAEAEDADVDSSWTDSGSGTRANDGFATDSPAPQRVTKGTTVTLTTADGVDPTNTNCFLTKLFVKPLQLPNPGRMDNLPVTDLQNLLVDSTGKVRDMDLLCSSDKSLQIRSVKQKATATLSAAHHEVCFSDRLISDESITVSYTTAAGEVLKSSVLPATRHTLASRKLLGLPLDGSESEGDKLVEEIKDAMTDNVLEVLEWTYSKSKKSWYLESDKAMIKHNAKTASDEAETKVSTSGVSQHDPANAWIRSAVNGTVIPRNAAILADGKPDGVQLNQFTVGGTAVDDDANSQHVITQSGLNWLAGKLCKSASTTIDSTAIRYGEKTTEATGLDALCKKLGSLDQALSSNSLSAYATKFQELFEAGATSGDVSGLKLLGKAEEGNEILTVVKSLLAAGKSKISESRLRIVYKLGNGDLVEVRMQNGSGSTLIHASQMFQSEVTYKYVESGISAPGAPGEAITDGFKNAPALPADKGVDVNTIRVAIGTRLPAAQKDKHNVIPNSVPEDPVAGDAGFWRSAGGNPGEITATGTTPEYVKTFATETFDRFALKQAYIVQQVELPDRINGAGGDYREAFTNLAAANQKSKSDKSSDSLLKAREGGGIGSLAVKAELVAPEAQGLCTQHGIKITYDLRKKLTVESSTNDHGMLTVDGGGVIVNNEFGSSANKNVSKLMIELYWLPAVCVDKKTTVLVANKGSGSAPSTSADRTWHYPYLGGSVIKWISHDSKDMRAFTEGGKTDVASAGDYRFDTSSWFSGSDAKKVTDSEANYKRALDTLSAFAREAKDSNLTAEAAKHLVSYHQSFIWAEEDNTAWTLDTDRTSLLRRRQTTAHSMLPTSGEISSSSIFDGASDAALYFGEFMFDSVQNWVTLGQSNMRATNPPYADIADQLTVNESTVTQKLLTSNEALGLVVPSSPQFEQASILVSADASKDGTAAIESEVNGHYSSIAWPKYKQLSTATLVSSSDTASLPSIVVADQDTDFFHFPDDAYSSGATNAVTDAVSTRGQPNIAIYATYEPSKGGYGNESAIKAITDILPPAKACYSYDKASAGAAEDSSKICHSIPAVDSTVSGHGSDPASGGTYTSSIVYKPCETLDKVASANAEAARKTLNNDVVNSYPPLEGSSTKWNEDTAEMFVNCGQDSQSVMNVISYVAKDDKYELAEAAKTVDGGNGKRNHCIDNKDLKSGSTSTDLVNKLYKNNNAGFVPKFTPPTRASEAQWLKNIFFQTYVTLWTESEWDSEAAMKSTQAGFLSSITSASKDNNVFVNSVVEAISKSTKSITTIYKIRVQTTVWDIRSSEVKPLPTTFDVNAEVKAFLYSPGQNSGKWVVRYTDSGDPEAPGTNTFDSPVAKHSEILQTIHVDDGLALEEAKAAMDGKIQRWGKECSGADSTAKEKWDTYGIGQIVGSQIASGPLRVLRQDLDGDEGWIKVREALRSELKLNEVDAPLPKKKEDFGRMLKDHIVTDVVGKLDAPYMVVVMVGDSADKVIFSSATMPSSTAMALKDTDWKFPTPEGTDGTDGGTNRSSLTLSKQATAWASESSADAAVAMAFSTLLEKQDYTFKGTAPGSTHMSINIINLHDCIVSADQVISSHHWNLEALNPPVLAQPNAPPPVGCLVSPEDILPHYAQLYDPSSAVERDTKQTSVALCVNGKDKEEGSVMVTVSDDKFVHLRCESDELTLDRRIELEGYLTNGRLQCITNATSDEALKAKIKDPYLLTPKTDVGKDKINDSCFSKGNSAIVKPSFPGVDTDVHVNLNGEVQNMDLSPAKIIVTFRGGQRGAEVSANGAVAVGGDISERYTNPEDILDTTGGEITVDVGASDSPAITAIRAMTKNSAILEGNGKEFHPADGNVVSVNVHAADGTRKTDIENLVEQKKSSYAADPVGELLKVKKAVVDALEANNIADAAAAVENSIFYSGDYSGFSLSIEKDKIDKLREFVNDYWLVVNKDGSILSFSMENGVVVVPPPSTNQVQIASVVRTNDIYVSPMATQNQITSSIVAVESYSINTVPVSVSVKPISGDEKILVNIYASLCVKREEADIINIDPGSARASKAWSTTKPHVFTLASGINSAYNSVGTQADDMFGDDTGSLSETAILSAAFPAQYKKDVAQRVTDAGSAAKFKIVPSENLTSSDDVLGWVLAKGVANSPSVVYFARLYTSKTAAETAAEGTDGVVMAIVATAKLPADDDDDATDGLREVLSKGTLPYAIKIGDMVLSKSNLDDLRALLGEIEVLVGVQHGHFEATLIDVDPSESVDTKSLSDMLDEIAKELADKHEQGKTLRDRILKAMLEDASNDGGTIARFGLLATEEGVNVFRANIFKRELKRAIYRILSPEGTTDAQINTALTDYRDDIPLDSEFKEFLLSKFPDTEEGVAINNTINAGTAIINKLLDERVSFNDIMKENAVTSSYSVKDIAVAKALQEAARTAPDEAEDEGSILNNVDIAAIAQAVGAFLRDENYHGVKIGQISGAIKQSLDDAFGGISKTLVAQADAGAPAQAQALLKGLGEAVMKLFGITTGTTDFGNLISKFFTDIYEQNGTQILLNHQLNRITAVCELIEKEGSEEDKPIATKILNDANDITVTATTLKTASDAIAEVQARVDKLLSTQAQAVVTGGGGSGSDLALLEGKVDKIVIQLNNALGVKEKGIVGALYEAIAAEAGDFSQVAPVLAGTLKPWFNYAGAGAAVPSTAWSVKSNEALKAEFGVTAASAIRTNHTELFPGERKWWAFGGVHVTSSHPQDPMNYITLTGGDVKLDLSLRGILNEVARVLNGFEGGNPHLLSKGENALLVAIHGELQKLFV